MKAHIEWVEKIDIKIKKSTNYFYWKKANKMAIQTIRSRKMGL